MELEVFKNISEYGLLGAILALVAWFALRLWRDLQGSWQERLSENKSIISVIQATNASYVAIAAANEHMSQAQSATSQALENQIKEIDDLGAKNERVFRSMDKIAVQLERLRQDLGAAQGALDERRKTRGAPSRG